MDRVSISIPTIIANLEKLYHQLVDEGFDMTDPIVLKERLKQMYNESSEFEKISSNRLTGTLNQYIKKKFNDRTIDFNRQDEKPTEPDSISFRQIFVNAMMLCDENRYLQAKNDLKRDNICFDIVEEYVTNADFVQPDSSILLYVIDTLLLFGGVGYQMMEVLDSKYKNKKEDLTPSVADELLKRILPHYD